MPALRVFLGQPRLMASHPFHQTVGQLQPGIGPVPAAAEVEGGRAGDQQGPQGEKTGVGEAARPGGRRDPGGGEIDQGGGARHRSRQQRSFENVRFDHPPQVPPHAFGARLVDRQMERSGQQALLQAGAEGQCRQPRDPATGHLQRHDRHQDQRQRRQPSDERAGRERDHADDGPRREIESGLGEMETGEEQRLAADAVPTQQARPIGFSFRSLSSQQPPTGTSRRHSERMPSRARVRRRGGIPASRTQASTSVGMAATIPADMALMISAQEIRRSLRSGERTRSDAPRLPVNMMKPSRPSDSILRIAGAASSSISRSLG